MDEDIVTFNIKGENGEDIECEVLFTYENAVTGKTYIAYTDNSCDEEGNTKVYASIFDPEQTENYALLPIETQEEWDIIDGILASISRDGEE